jgi:hypothetical protein
MTKELQRTGSFSRSQQFLSQSVHSLQFTVPEVPLPFSHHSSNCPRPEPHQSTAHLIQHIHIHSHSLRRFELCPGPRLFLPFRQHATFLRRGVVGLSLNNQARKPPLVGSPLLSMQYTHSYYPYLQVVSSNRTLRTRHAVARPTLIMVVRKIRDP